ncbi:MAG: cell division inhibitor [Finegoldia magna]|uniref:cell division inhibitor n=1 Tax=Finegoldia TaxID=150022 RepID=UPI00288B66CF|nr:cell division inhibitor [Finegoldia magna]MDU2897702.1 cell division inhibitor [Finegoldia magna]MDU5368775.1 cell division inhibitor [Finegoldia magna]MDU5443184.1 cell division inhibitor [Finegoldia magna]
MKTVLVNSQLQKKALLIQSLCNLLDGKILIVNSEKSREIEYALGVEDYCVYDTLDVLSNVVDYKKSMVKIREDRYVIPSTIKPEKYSATKVDYENLLDNLSEFDIVIFTEDIGIEFDEEIMWGNEEKSHAKKLYQITDSSSKRKSDYKYIGKLEFTKEYEKKINSYSENVDEKLTEIIQNYKQDKEAKIGFFDRIFKR